MNMLNNLLVGLGNLWLAIPKAVRSSIYSAISALSALAAADVLKYSGGETISPYLAVILGMVVTFLAWISTQAAKEAAVESDIRKYQDAK